MCGYLSPILTRRCSAHIPRLNHKLDSRPAEGCELHLRLAYESVLFCAQRELQARGIEFSDLRLLRVFTIDSGDAFLTPLTKNHEYQPNGEIYEQ